MCLSVHRNMLFQIETCRFVILDKINIRGRKKDVRICFNFLPRDTSLFLDNVLDHSFSVSEIL